MCEEVGELGSGVFAHREGMSRLLESRRQDRMKEINLKVSYRKKE